MVCELRVEPLYELEVLNIMFKIFDSLDVLKRNNQGKLVINCDAEPNTDFNSLFSSIVGQIHNLQQTNIYKF